MLQVALVCPSSVSRRNPTDTFHGTNLMTLSKAVPCNHVHTEAGESNKLFVGFKRVSTKAAVRVKVAVLQPLQIRFHTTLHWR